MRATIIRKDLCVILMSGNPDKELVSHGIREERSRFYASLSRVSILFPLCNMYLHRKRRYRQQKKPAYAAEHAVAIEINANPWRLDLDWRMCERDLKLGFLFSIDHDAHSTEEMDNVD